MTSGQSQGHISSLHLKMFFIVFRMIIIIIIIIILPFPPHIVPHSKTVVSQHIEKIFHQMYRSYLTGLYSPFRKFFSELSPQTPKTLLSLKLSTNETMF